MRGMPRDARIMIRLPDGKLVELALVKPMYTRADSDDETIAAAPGGRYTIVLSGKRGLANKRPLSHAPAMFAVTEEDETAIRAVYEQRGEFAAAIELRQRFPGVTDNTQARECARTIAGWKPLPLRPVKRMPKAPRLRRML